MVVLNSLMQHKWLKKKKNNTKKTQEKHNKTTPPTPLPKKPQGNPSPFPSETVFSLPKNQGVLVFF